MYRHIYYIGAVGSLKQVTSSTAVHCRVSSNNKYTWAVIGFNDATWRDLPVRLLSYNAAKALQTLHCHYCPDRRFSTFFFPPRPFTTVLRTPKCQVIIYFHMRRTRVYGISWTMKYLLCIQKNQTIQSQTFTFLGDPLPCLLALNLSKSGFTDDK